MDGWEFRRVFTDLMEQDLVPPPKVIIPILRACRRLNDFALTIRVLEGVKIKCGGNRAQKIVFPWIMQEIKTVLEELGIPTLEEIGYDKPELYVPNPEYWWEKEWYFAHGYDKIKGFEEVIEKIKKSSK